MSFVNYQKNTIIITLDMECSDQLFFWQELLRLQYEGATVMDMFGKAKINVNLLLHFLNTKFYGK